jgi:hypothetical protein
VFSPLLVIPERIEDANPESQANNFWIPGSFRFASRPGMTEN